MDIGTKIIHCMGHIGIVVALDGPLAIIVRFVNTTDRVWVSDVEVVL